MSALSSLTILLSTASIAVGMLSLLLPQKRTRRILSFVIGLFILVILTNGVKSAIGELRFEDILTDDADIPSYSEDDYHDAVVQQTADTLVKAIDELLQEEGVIADDIRLRLDISDEGRIYADRIDIYISEQYRDRKSDIRSIIYGNLSKEPVIHVKGQEAE